MSATLGFEERARQPRREVGAGAPGARPAKPGEGGAMVARRGRRWGWVDAGGLLVLLVFSLAAAMGFALFGRDPARVAALGEGAARFYAASFGLFARGQVLVAAAVLAVVLIRAAGVRWVPALVAVYVASLGSELLGTAWGIPFGAYRYTSLLGVKWLGLVPVLIPLSWFFMAVPSYGLARRASGDRRWLRLLAGSLLLLAWDLVLDPAMSEVTRYWVWAERGPYYGMPLTNLFGWYVTGLVLMGVLEVTGGRSWLDRVSPVWLGGFYVANLVLPLGLAAAAGLWGAVLAPLVVLGVMGGVAWRLRPRQPVRAVIRPAASSDREVVR